MNPRSLLVSIRRLAVGSMLACFGLVSAANPALARKYGCLGCHAVAAPLVGPAYQDVAAKYAGQADAVAILVQSIRTGGSGRWGELAMPPQPQVTPADAQKLAHWILGGAK